MKLSPKQLQMQKIAIGIVFLFLIHGLCAESGIGIPNLPNTIIEHMNGVTVNKTTVYPTGEKNMALNAIPNLNYVVLAAFASGFLIFYLNSA